MSRHVKIGESAPLRRLKVGQYFVYPHWYVVYRLDKPISKTQDERGFILKYCPHEFNHEKLRGFPTSSQFTEVASIADGVGGFGTNTIVKVVAKPAGEEISNT